jgi:hypothetical protein
MASDFPVSKSHFFYSKSEFFLQLVLDGKPTNRQAYDLLTQTDSLSDS